MLAIGLGLWALRAPDPDKPLARVQLSDGRLLQIEGVSYGTNHVIGKHSAVVERFSPWLPAKVREFVTPKVPRSEIDLDRPKLVVWVNALDPKTGQQVDCQGIRVEFKDEHGDLFGEENRHWFGHQAYWRVGHEFQAFPRQPREWTLQITPWRSNQTTEVKLANPFRATASAAWSTKPLPQSLRVGDLDIVLASLARRTNGAPGKYWETATRYWEPNWELRRRGPRVTDWEDPEWFAEDGTGNRGQFLGLHAPALRFTARFFPRATNTTATVVLTNGPMTSLADKSATNWWNVATRHGSNAIQILGLFPAGIHIFSDGVLQTNPPVAMGPTMGGAPSGWVGSSRRLTPSRVQFWNGHYSPGFVVFAHSDSLPSRQRLAIRLRDNHGRNWAAKPEPEGAVHGIHPFLVEVPADVTAITAELIVLTPVEATFTVETPRLAD